MNITCGNLQRCFTQTDSAAAQRIKLPVAKILEEIISADQGCGRQQGEDLFRASRQVVFMRILAAVKIK